MFFKDRNNRQEGILAKSRKQISKAGRLLMALAVGGCLWGQGEVGLAGTTYVFDNPSSNNNIVP